MKFYLASSFELIDKVEKAAESIEAAGYCITEKWWERPYQVEGLGLIQTDKLHDLYDDLPSEDFYSKPETKFSFEADYKGVMDADVFLFVADDKPRKYNGANVELGIALAAMKYCAYIGVLENCVLYYPVKKFRDIEELLHYLFGS